MDFHIYNTLTRKKELFVPIKTGQAKIYSCGPTVYSHQHIGNMRAAFIVDLLRLVLQHIGEYDVIHVMNITDVGHLTGDNEGDANTGEDRMEKGARKEGVTAWEVADKYITIYLDDLAFLGIDAGLEKGKHNIYMPRATDHITEQIDMIQQLEKKGYTYIVEGDGVYMDTATYKDYGVLLSDKHLAGLEEGARVDLKGKKNLTDFALWKFNMTGKKRDMERASPRGIGFPGRHIECSAMSIAHLGKKFDIHTGGMEHIPVHHTNEIAQAECSCADHPWVNYRVHYQRLMMNGKKIAKSDGNVAFLADIREKGFTGEDMRMFYLQAHYRSFQDFTRESLEAAKQGRKGLQKKISDIISGGKVEESSTISEGLKTMSAQSLRDDLTDSFVANFFDDLMSAITNDLDTVKLLAALNHNLNAITKNKLTIDTKELFMVLHWLDTHILKIGLFQQQEAVQVPAAMQSHAQSRRDAKLAKDYATADELRKQLHAAGRDILDGKDGFEIVLLK